MSKKGIKLFGVFVIAVVTFFFLFYTAAISEETVTGKIVEIESGFGGEWTILKINRGADDKLKENQLGWVEKDGVNIAYIKIINLKDNEAIARVTELTSMHKVTEGLSVHFSSESIQEAGKTVYIIIAIVVLGLIIILVIIYILTTKQIKLSRFTSLIKSLFERKKVDEKRIKEVAREVVKEVKKDLKKDVTKDITEEPVDIRPANLEILSGPRKGEKIRLLMKNMIGQVKGDIVFPEEKTVSREHARIEYVDNGYVIFNLSKVNQIVVNKKTVEEKHKLEEGDKIEIGRIKLRFSFLDSYEGMETVKITGKPAEIEILSGPRVGETIRLLMENKIGRNEGDITFPGEKTVSREHAKIVNIDNYHYIFNLSQKNPVMVNGEAIEEKCELNDGDKIKFGVIEVKFKLFE